MPILSKILNDNLKNQNGKSKINARKIFLESFHVNFFSLSYSEREFFSVSVRKKNIKIANIFAKNLVDILKNIDNKQKTIKRNIFMKFLR